MTHPLTADLRQSHLNAALLTDHTAVLEPLVFSTQALVILYWAKNFGAKETVAFWLKSTIVNGLWLFDLAKGPLPHHLWRRQSDSDGVEVFIFFSAQQI